MKQNLSKVLLGVALAGCSAASDAGPLTLVKNGQPNATIVMQANAPAPIKSAATDLQKYLAKISGVTLPLKTDGKDILGITLNVGKTATTLSSDLPDSKLNPETYAITQRNDDVYFEGNYPSPTAFAVYSFLQDQLGVRWFAPGDDWEYVPQNTNKSTFTINVKNVVSVPGTSPRVWSGHAWTKDWTDWDLRNKAVQSEKVPRRNFQNNMYHIFPPSKYAKTHPEYYPLVNGKRYIPVNDSESHWWPAIGDPNVQRITAEYIHQWFKDHPDQDSFSLGMDDVAYMSDDPLSDAMDSSPDDYKHRNFSSRFYKFINIIAKQVKKTDPDKYIGTLIYSIALKPPVDVPQMEDNVFGYIANGSVAQWYHPGKEDDWKNLTLDWRKRVKHLSRYDYYGMGTHVPRVFPHAIDDSIKFDKSLGFDGMYVEVYTFLPQTAPMIWAFAQLEWDPQKNVDVLLDDFYSKMFPSDTADVKKYFDLMEKSWNTERPGHTGWVHRNIIHQATSISPEAVEQGMQLLNAAYAKAKTPVEKRRIDVIRGGLQFGSYAVLEYDLAQQLSAISVTNETQANAALAKVQKFAELIDERGTYWAQAEKRDDILGANIRGLSIIKPGRSEGYLQRNFAPIESPAIPGILRVIDWYQTNQPDKAPQITQDLVSKLPAGFIKDAVEASRWLDDASKTGAKSLLKNGDFENNSKNTAEAKEDWETKGAPVGWSTWSRMGSGEFVRVQGHTPSSKGIRVNAPSSGETSDLLQNLSVKSGERYVSTVWVKLDDPAHASDVVLSFRFRDASGWLKGNNATQRAIAATADGWQKLMLAVTVPHGATSVSVMLGVSNTSATFDDALVYLLPQ